MNRAIIHKAWILSFYNAYACVNVFDLVAFNSHELIKLFMFRCWDLTGKCIDSGCNILCKISAGNKIMPISFDNVNSFDFGLWRCTEKMNGANEKICDCHKKRPMVEWFDGAQRSTEAVISTLLHDFMPSLLIGESFAVLGP